jgi:hypothetical protein
MEIPDLKTSKGWSKKKRTGEWAETLQNFLSKKQDVVPPGWLRSDDALHKMGLSGSCSGQRNKLLNSMHREGFLEKKDFKIFDNSGRRVTAITHYKIAKSHKSLIIKEK